MNKFESMLPYLAAMKKPQNTEAQPSQEQQGPTCPMCCKPVITDVPAELIQARNQLSAQTEAVRKLLETIDLAQRPKDCNCTSQTCRYLGTQIVLAAEKLRSTIEGK